MAVLEVVGIVVEAETVAIVAQPVMEINAVKI